MMSQLLQQCIAWPLPKSSSSFFISKVQFGILNALPLPALDGGQMAFIILEALRRGKKLDIRKQVLQNKIKVILLFERPVMIGTCIVSRAIIFQIRCFYEWVMSQHLQSILPILLSIPSLLFTALCFAGRDFSSERPHSDCHQFDCYGRRC